MTTLKYPPKPAGMSVKLYAARAYEVMKKRIQLHKRVLKGVMTAAQAKSELEEFIGWQFKME